MSTRNENNNGLLICGACAISANPDPNEPSSIGMLGNAIRNLFTRKSSTRMAGKAN